MTMGIKERKNVKRTSPPTNNGCSQTCFSEKGYSRATMEDIAKEAELSAGTIYLYFKNKDELCASLTLRILQYLQMRVEHVYNEKHQGISEKIDSLKEAMHDVYEFDPLILRNMFHLHSSETFKNLSSELLDEINRLSRKSIRTIGMVFKDSLDDGVFGNRDAMEIAYVVWAVFSGLALWEESRKTFAYESDLKETLSLAFDIIRVGLFNYSENEKK
ncbi:MAG: HTH-type transcriptional regulator [Candidatus Magnetoglobus multicellularis str. Araruama]|uniref:HTH-type transcriptional regulator n=1 Tax=Candidatus Magnetoglobus multicellularis str. Araruama TaxID=890399 RepID=A0A1V1P6A7_9BACT|nr:MAG: HTH-type transcriptional regulator [Candidatus Magnetoglobus multicellularis str. Araruama]